MSNALRVKLLQNFILFCTFAITLSVTPGLNLDPINLPKLALLIICGSAISWLVLPYLWWLRKVSWLLFISFSSFVLILIYVYLSNGDQTQIYGNFGRNTGLLSYISLTTILIGAISVSGTSFSRKLIWLIIASGSLNTFYGIVQWLDLDPISWATPYSRILGTFGNPNFLSAFLGMSSIASFSVCLGFVSYRVRLLLSLNIVLSILVIYKSDSQQGILMFGIGVLLLSYFKWLNHSNNNLKLGFIFTTGVFLVAATLGLLNKGIFAKVLYQESLIYRLDYWIAGWNMTKNSPFTGVGLDSYLYWYRQFRSEESVMRRGPDVVADSAHNVFLDISSNGGFLLFLSYSIIMGLILNSCLVLVRRTSAFDPIVFGLVVCWLSYIIQSLGSINNLGLAIWGWVIGGALIGEDNFRYKNYNFSIMKVFAQRTLGAKMYLLGGLSIISGIAIAVKPIYKDAVFKEAIVMRNSSRIEMAANSFPRHGFYFNLASRYFRENKQDLEALEMSRLAIELNVRDFDAYMNIVVNPLASNIEKRVAFEKLKELDPFNENLIEEPRINRGN